MLQFSVIIPLYNATPYIHRCLNSIFDLGVPEDEFEILCINDCSTDNTIEVVTEIAAKHPSVRLINHFENKLPGGVAILVLGMQVVNSACLWIKMMFL